jgi:hypothetical protein
MDDIGRDARKVVVCQGCWSMERCVDRRRSRPPSVGAAACTEGFKPMALIRWAGV